MNSGVTEQKMHTRNVRNRRAADPLCTGRRIPRLLVDLRTRRLEMAPILAMGLNRELAISAVHHMRGKQENRTWSIDKD